MGTHFTQISSQKAALWPSFAHALVVGKGSRIPLEGDVATPFVEPQYLLFSLTIT